MYVRNLILVSQTYPGKVGSPAKPYHWGIFSLNVKRWNKVKLCLRETEGVSKSLVMLVF